MIIPGKIPEKKIDTYNFQEVAEILSISNGKKILGRTGIMLILKKCNVLKSNGTAHFRFVEEGYFSNHTLQHQPRVEVRHDDYALVIGKKGLDFIKKIIVNYLVDQTPPFPPSPVNPYSGQMYL